MRLLPRLDDRGVLDGMADKVAPGGLMMFFTGSFAYDGAAKCLILEKEAGLVEEAPHTKPADFP